MRIKLPVFIITLLVIVISVLLVTFTSLDLWQGKKYPVTIAVSKTPLSTPFYVAKTIHAFDSTCVDATFIDVVGGQTAFAMMMSGEADFSTSSDSVIAFQSLTGKAFVSHAVFAQSDNDVKLITQRADNNKTIVDLKNQTIGVTKGTASEYFLSILLAMEGMTLDDVKVKHYPTEQLVEGLINNEVDAIVPWEPYVYQAKSRLQNEISIFDSKNLNTLTFNLLSQPADNELVEKAGCVIDALRIAIDYIATHPLKAQQIMMSKLTLSPSYIDWAWPDYIFKLGLNQSLLLNIKSQARWAIESQMADYQQTPSVDAFIDTRAMFQVDAKAVNIPQ
ncbi:ABC transporter substrate-binding protein [Colwellia sp. KU-HH00111]|uniref:ABC transporter substrate-binding protein n=1 Tax=Colwellia sp. KU-HH00111 TaxID=3127652 RepID=UPI00310A6AA1